MGTLDPGATTVPASNSWPGGRSAERREVACPIPNAPQRGSSVDFAQHRAYAPGESPKILFQHFARSDRVVVKEYVEEMRTR